MLYIALPRFAGLVLPLLLASALQAQTIPNPSFEANGDFATFPGYAANNGGVITGWTMSDASHIGINGTNGPFYNNGASPDGTHVAFLQSTGGSSVLSNTITGLIPGVSYQVSFRANMSCRLCCSCLHLCHSMGVPSSPSLLRRRSTPTGFSRTFFTPTLPSSLPPTPLPRWSCRKSDRLGYHCAGG